MGPRKLLFLAAFLTASLCAASASSIVPTVVLGTDYLQTQPGTFFVFPDGIGRVPLKGLPVGPFSTDTIIERLANATINGPAIPIQLTALSLQSTGFVKLGGTDYKVYVTLNPADLALDTGTLRVFSPGCGATTCSGTFNSTINVYFLVKLVPVGGGTTIVIPDEARFFQHGGIWSSTPPPGIVIVRGPLGDQAANLHANLPMGDFDFFPSLINEIHSGGGRHKVKSAVTPEPETLLLSGPALAGLLFWWGRRRSYWRARQKGSAND